MASNELTLRVEPPVPVSQNQVYLVCEAVCYGASLEEACQRPGFPSREVFLGWLMRDPTVAMIYQKAREVSAYSLEDEALALLRERVKTPKSALDLRAAEALVQQIRWAASKRNPQVFSEKSAVNVTVPIQINTTLDLGTSPGQGTAEFPNIYALEAQVTQEVETPRDPDTPILEGGELKVRKRKREYVGKNTGARKRQLKALPPDEYAEKKRKASEVAQKRADVMRMRVAARKALEAAGA